MWLQESTGSRQKELITVVSLTFIQAFLLNMMIPTVPLLAKDGGASEFQLGIITTIPALIAILASIPSNALSLKYGHRTLLLWAQIAGLLGGVLFYFSKSLISMFLPQFFIGITNMLHWSIEGAYKTEIILPKQRALLLAYALVVSNIGAMAGPVTAGFLIDKMGYKPVFLVYIAMSLAATLIANTLPKIRPQEEGDIKEAIKSGFKIISRIIKRPMIQVTIGISFLQLLTLSTQEIFLPTFMKETGYSATVVGMTVTSRIVAMTAILFLAAPLMKRFGPLTVFFAGSFISAGISGLVPGFPKTSFILLSCFVAGLGLGGSPVYSSDILADHTEIYERAMAMALNLTMVNAGRTASGFVIGAIASNIGSGPVLFLANAVALIGALFLLIRHFRMTKAKSAEPEAL